MANGRNDEQDTPLVAKASQGRIRVWGLFGETHLGQRSCSRVEGRTHDRTRSVSQIKQSPLRSRGRSLIAPPLSTASCLLLLLSLLSPYRGHGSLRGRRKPPQHLVRSTGAAMSTTGSHGNDAAQRPPSQLACTLAPVGNPHIRTAVRMDLGRLATRPGPALALTSGMARPTARCCAGSRTACGLRPRAPCRGLTASQWPAPSPSGLMPA